MDSKDENDPGARADDPAGRSSEDRAAGATPPAKTRLERVPEEWFARPLYSPRIARPQGERWFLLDPAFRPPETVPSAAPREPGMGREALAGALRDTARNWGLPGCPESDHGIRLAGAAGTALVVTGQQPGFLGGPLFVLWKALTAIAVAAKYRSLTGRPCVPIFWVAGEDHDLEEVRDARFPGLEGRESVFRYPHPADRRPISAYPIDAEAERVLEEARSHFAPRRHGSEVGAAIDLYRGRGLAGGFAAILATYLGGKGLVFLDPTRLRVHATDLFRRAIEKPEEILACLERGRREVRALGIEPFASARFPLFLELDGRRHHLSPTPGGLEVDGGGPSFRRADLLLRLRETPEAFSPGALLRPLLEQSLVSSILTVGGPAECGYLAQVGPLAEYLRIPSPKAALRLTATLIGGKAARTLETVPAERLVRARDATELLARAAPAREVEALGSIAVQVESAIGSALRLVAPSGEPPRSLRRAREIPGDIRGFAERIEKALAATRETEMEAARNLWNMVFPEGALQERRWGFLHFLAKHGRGWIDTVLEELAADPLSLVHRWIVLGD